MSANVTKGQRVGLNAVNGKIDTMLIEVGWDTDSTVGYEIDLEAFLLGDDGKVLDDSCIVFYNNPSILDGRILHMGIVQGGSSSSKRGQIKVDLSGVPDKISKINFTLTIHEGIKRGQSFKNVSRLYINILDYNTQGELLKYSVDEVFSVETALVLGELYRYKGTWKFNAIGSGFKGGLAAICNNYGIETEEEVQEASQVQGKTQPLNQSDVRLFYNDGGLWYEGGLLNGLFNGKGRLYRRDGSVSYDAEFKDGKLYGYGKNILKSGEIRFEGYFENDEPVKGKYYENGNLRYEGEFLKNKPHGYGKFIDKSGTMKYNGKFDRGTFIG